MLASISGDTERRIVVIVVAAYAVLALGFSLGPIFEGPDELEHFRYIMTIVQSGMLPSPYAQPLGEYHQAPLYYLLAAPLGVLVRDSDFTKFEQRVNPFYAYAIGIPGSDNKNKYLHSRDESFPYANDGSVRAVHVLRLLSIALGAATLAASYAIFRLLWQDRADLRLAALGFVAFQPQFVYISSTINNDNLLILLATTSLYLLLKLQRESPSRRLTVAFGIVLGAALLTKISALFLIFPVAALLLMNRSVWRPMLVAFGVVLLVAGWWYLRNELLYDDFTNFKAWFTTWPNEAIQPGALALDIGLARMPDTYATFWARFGSGAVSVGAGLYDFFDALVMVAAVGLAFRLIMTLRSHSRLTSHTIRQGVVVGVFASAWILAVLYTASTAWSGGGGRYLLPAIAAWSALLALGVMAWIPGRLRVLAALVSVGGMGLVTGVCLFGYFLPSYNAPPAPSILEHPLSLQFGDVAQLIGIRSPMLKVRPGDVAQITLYWRVLRQPEAALYTYLHSIETQVVRRDSVPGTGNFPTSDWQPGDTWAETYTLIIPTDAPAQSVDSLLAGLYDPLTKQPLPVTDGRGQVVTPIVGQIAVNGSPQHVEPVYWFGDAIGLAEPQVTLSRDQLKVCLTWESLASTSVDYHAFLHVLGSDNQLLAQSDSAPKNGQYPTNAWSPGEAIDDCVTLAAPGLPANGWTVALGLYDANTKQRLPIRDRAGQSLRDETLILLPQG